MTRSSSAVQNLKVLSGALKFESVFLPWRFPLLCVIFDFCVGVFVTHACELVSVVSKKALQHAREIHQQPTGGLITRATVNHALLSSP